MSSPYKILIRIIVEQFYIANTGFFLFFFLLFFGIMPPQYLISTHYTLILAIISSPLALGAGVLWIFYSIKCFDFFKKNVLKYRDSFLSIYQLMNHSKLLFLIGFIFMLIFFPVLIYAIFVIIIAFFVGSYLAAICFSLLLLLIFMVSILRVHTVFVNGINDNIKWLSSFQPLSKGILGFNWFFLIYLLKHRVMSLLVLKTISIGGLYALLVVYEESFKKKYFGSFILFIAIAHGLIIFFLHKLKEERMSFLRNLPLKSRTKLRMLLNTGCFLFLPELITMFQLDSNVISFLDTLMFYSLLISQFILYFVLLYSDTFSFRKYVRYLFVILATLWVLSLFIGFWALIPFCLGLSYLIYREHYLEYEHFGAGDKI